MNDFKKIQTESLLILRGSYNKMIFLSVVTSILLSRFIASATVVALPFILIILKAFLESSFYTQKRIGVLLGLMFLTVAVLLLHGFVEAKNILISLLGILVTSYYVQKKYFSPYLILTVYVLIFIPQFIFEYLTVGGVSYFPFNGSINVVSSTATKHGTSILGILILISIISFFAFKSKFNNTLRLFFLLSIYFIIFSGSRGGVISVFFGSLIYFVNYQKVGALKTYFLVVLGILVMFSLETLVPSIIGLIKNDWILNFLGANNYKNYGVTSGRYWLWEYHLNKFLESKYYLGVGSDEISFGVNDFVPELGEVAKAGSESPFTKLLAGLGLIGVAIICVYLSLLKKAVGRKNKYAVAIIALALFQGIGSGIDYFSYINYNSVLFLNMLFFILKNDNKV